MSTEDEKRMAVLVALRTRRNPNEIFEFFKGGISRATVFRLAKKFKEDENVSTKRKIQDRTHCKKRTADFLTLLEAKIEENPSMSIADLAKFFNMSYPTMWTAVHEDLRYKSYKLQIRQLLTTLQMSKRLERSKGLLSIMKKGPGTIFFSDEKIFSVDRSINKQNDRWLAKDPDSVPVVMKTKHPASVMCLAVISSAGDIMPPHFFKPKESVTKEVYLAVLQSKIVPWMQEVMAGAPFVFQQNGAPAHTSQLVQSFLTSELGEKGFWKKEQWPPSSPDLNPCDYFLWGIVERAANRTFHPNTSQLKDAITQSMADLNRDTVARACKKFRARLDNVVAKEGNYFE